MRAVHPRFPLVLEELHRHPALAAQEARDPNEAKTDYVSLFGAIAQIVASTVAIIVVATR